MGIKFEAKTDRNYEIYRLYNEKGYLTREDRERICKDFDIGMTRLYRIIKWCKSRN